jgi:hypothetical protein
MGLRTYFKGMGPQVAAFWIALPLVMVGSCAGAGLAFEVYYAFPNETQRQGWWGPILNKYAPGLGGLLVTMFVCEILRRTGRYSPKLRAHLLRGAGWYLVVGLILMLNHAQRGVLDYGLWSQLVNWPLVGLLVGLGFDLLMTAFAPFVPALRSVVEGGQGADGSVDAKMG